MYLVVMLYVVLNLSTPGRITHQFIGHDRLITLYYAVYECTNTFT